MSEPLSRDQIRQRLWQAQHDDDPQFGRCDFLYLPDLEALLDDLERAEKERESEKTHARITREENIRWVEKLEVAESHLSRFVEAAHTLVRLDLAPDVEHLVILPGDPTPLAIAAEYDGALARLRDALAAIEDEQ